MMSNAEMTGVICGGFDGTVAAGGVTAAVRHTALPRYDTAMAI